MKPHGFIRVVKRWRGLRADPVLKCLDDPEGLKNRYLPSGHGPRVPVLGNNLRPGTAVPS
jgi:hypothetical protein